MRTKIYFLRGENRFVVYVGKRLSSKPLKGRLDDHIREAISGHHCKKCCGIRDMLRRGLSPTISEITEVEGNGNNAERAYIKWLWSYGINLWNGTGGGDGGALVGEALQRMTIAARLSHQTPETKQRHREANSKPRPWMRGRHPSNETRKKIKEARKKQKVHKGYHLSKETRRNMSEAKIKYWRNRHAANNK